MAKIIAVALPKGGVGKTTTAVNLAASLAVAEQQTLLIDLDAFGASGLSLGFTTAKIKAGLYEVFNFITSLPNAIHKTDLDYLDVIPSNVYNHQREERLSRISDNRAILKNALRPVADQYDYIILDCPPTLRGLTTNALTACESVLIPVKSGHFSLDAVDKMFAYLDWIRDVANRAIMIEGLLVTMHEPNTRVSDITLRELQLKYRKFLFDIYIPKNTVLCEASFYGKPAILYSANSRGAAAYMSLAREIIARRERSLSGAQNEEARRSSDTRASAV